MGATAWAAGPTIEAHVVGPDCTAPFGENVFVEVVVDPDGTPAVGYQALVQFDPAKFDFVAGKYTQEPYGLPVLNPITEDPVGVVEMAAGIDVFGGQTPVSDAAVVAVLEFAPIAECCATNFDFCIDCINANLISDENGMPLPGLKLVKSGDVQIDGTAPRISDCCDDVKLAAGANCLASVPDLTACVVATDNCPGALTVTQSPAAGTPIGLGVTAVTLTVSDCAGNSAQCQTNVEVNDQTPPTITCNDPFDDFPADNDCSVVVPDYTVHADVTDNCDNPIGITQDPPAGTILTGQGAYIITLTATDDAGNSATDTCTLTIVDLAQPKIADCPNDFEAKLDANCFYTLGDLTGNVVAVDNCTPTPLLTISQNPPAGTMLSGQGVTAVTITVTDLKGNVDTCVVNVTTVDNTPPTIVCGTWPDIKLDDDCKATVPDLLGVVTATDNCDGDVELSQSQAPGSRLIGQGTFPVTITATDDKGNSSSCEIILTTVDNTAPVITDCAQPVKIPGDANCEALVPQMTGVTATDNCTSTGDLVVTQNPLAGTVVGAGVTVVTVTVTDNKGNSSTCTTTVTVEDNDPPVITCPDNIAVECTGPGGAFVSFTTLVADACDPNPTLECVEIGVGPVVPAGQNYGLGRHLIQCTATDAAGNSASCIFTITVGDNTAPVITCPPAVEIKANENCQGILTDLTVDAIVSDLCDPTPVVTQSPPVGTALNGQGVTSVTLTATDAAGNSASCKVDVTVVDNAAPVIERCSNDVELVANDRCEALVPNLLPGVIATDNCGTVTLSQDPPANSIIGLGSTAVVITATDEKGNSSTCDVKITVVDQTAPKIFVCADDAELKADANCEAAAPDLTVDIVADDNCTDMAALVITQDPAAGTLLPLGANVISITVTDATGNSSKCEATITVVDNMPPSVTCPANIKVDAGITECQADVDPGTPTVTDNCSVASVNGKRDDGAQLDDPYPLGVTTITWTAVDGSGNEASCQQTVTVNDNTPPDITCPDDIDVNSDPGLCVADLDPGMATARDNCDDNVDITWTRSDGAANLDDPFDSADSPITIEWKATDDAGNMATCTQTIEVAAENTLIVDLELSPVVELTDLVRCITFDLYECTGPNVPPVATIEVDVTFTNGLARNVAIKVPCGLTIDCVTARDKLHTLTRTDDTPEIIGNAIHLEFLPLIGGNLNDDDIIDILDFAIFTAEFLTNYGTGDTPCGTPAPHADVSGNGVVFVEDFTFITANFRTVSDPLCCAFPGPQANLPGAIKVDDLFASGQAHLAVADLDGNGIIDSADMDMFASGVMPNGETLGQFVAAEGSWFDADNWAAGTPDAQTDVTISGSDITIDGGDAVARDVVVEAGSLRLENGGLVATNLVVADGAVLVLDDVRALLSIENLTLEAGASLAWNAGTIEVVGGMLSMDGALVIGNANEATLRLVDGGQVLASVVYVAPFGALTGDGAVAATVVSDGLVAPIRMTVLGDFVQGETGELRLTVDPLANVTPLHVTGTADLDGAISVVGEAAELLDATRVIGMFNLGPADLVYGENGVSIR